MSATKNVAAIPSASEIEIVMDVPEQNEVEEVEEEMTLEEMIKYLSELEATEIMEIVEKANGILKKKWKQIQPTESKLKKMNKPKKPASKALKRNQAWIPFVLKHAMENGWESFTIQRSIGLNFQAATQDFNGLARTSQQLTGVYEESMTLFGPASDAAPNEKTYRFRGPFTLNRISSTDTLTLE